MILLRGGAYWRPESSNLVRSDGQGGSAGGASPACNSSPIAIAQAEQWELSGSRELGRRLEHSLSEPHPDSRVQPIAQRSVKSGANTHFS